MGRAIQRLKMFRCVGVSAFAVALALCGCGGVSTNGVYLNGAPTRLAKVGVTYVKFVGRVATPGGEGVRGIDVRITTPRSVSEAITTHNGVFRGDAIFAEEEIIDFHFSGNGLEWSEELRNVPRGKDVVKLRFELDPMNRIRLAALEY